VETGFRVIRYYCQIYTCKVHAVVFLSEICSNFMRHLDNRQKQSVTCEEEIYFLSSTKSLYNCLE